MKNMMIAAVCAVLCAEPVLAGSPSAFDVRDYGAKGDGATKDTAAIQAAIDAAHTAGGGRVEFGAGTYLSGSIFLKSNVEIRLGSGAVLKGSPDRADYNKPDICPQNGTYAPESSVGAHLVLCIEQENVTVSGPGTIDGNSAAFLVDPRTGREWGHDPRPGHRSAGQGMIPFRPSQMLYFVECRNVRVRDLELRNSTYWNLFLHGCEQVSVRGLWIHNEWRDFHTCNGDGIDIDCSRHVTVSDCRISTADDCITLRASGKRLRKPGDCAYVTVANCTLSTPCNAVRAGVGEGRVHDCVFSNIAVHDARTAINFVSSWNGRSPDGVDFRNIRFMNWTVDCETLFYLYGGPLAPGVVRRAPMRDIYFDGFSGKVADGPEVRRSLISGCSAETPIENVRFRDIFVRTVAQVKNARGITVEGGTFAIEEEN